MTVRSIFYKSHIREENALTHRFLAICERLSNEGLFALFSQCDLAAMLDIGNLVSVDEQLRLGERRPDGILRFSNAVVAFENKVDTTHDTVTNGDSVQLEYYYKMLKKEYEGCEHRLLVVSDEDMQGPNEIRDLVAGLEIPMQDVGIVTWQRVHRACTDLMDSWNVGRTDMAMPTQLDRFLIDELRILLEDMGLAQYSGIQRSDLEALSSTWEQLELLDAYLTTHIAEEFPMVELYSRYRLYHSVLSDYLGFGFKACPDHTWLYVKLDRKRKQLSLGITMDDSSATSKLKGTPTLTELVESLDSARDFKVVMGSQKKEVDLTKKLDEYKSRKPAPQDVFEGYLNISKKYIFSELDKELGLSTSQLPRNLMKEVSRLKKTASLIQGKLSVK